MHKLFSIGLLLLCSFGVSAQTHAQMVVESKQLIAQFSRQLKSSLQQGIKDGGPSNAIMICHTEAAQIAQRVSEQTGRTIMRTSLKPRNSQNAPDPWEKEALENFEQRLKAGEAIENLALSEIIDTQSPNVFRFIKAIPTQQLCLTCHGDNLSPDVTERLHDLYPGDQATGYKVGDIRGAFSITYPIK